MNSVLSHLKRVRRMSACLTAVCVDLAKYKSKMLWYEYRIMCLFSHLACKEVYHIIIFICTACLYFAMEIVGEDPGSLHTLSLQYECDSIGMRIILDM